MRHPRSGRPLRGVNARRSAMDSSDHIREGPFHPPKIERAGYEKQSRDARARQDHAGPVETRAEEAIAEAPDNPGHGVEAIEPTRKSRGPEPLLDLARGVDHRGHEKP